jgi:putative MATE family efflux protein
MARQARLSSVDRRILRLAVPALGALAADPLLSLVDTVFVSRLGTVSLAALGVDTALFSFAFFVFNFLAYATTPMVARRLGAGDDAGAGRVVAQAIFLGLALGVVTAIGLIVFAPFLVRLMQASGEVVDPAMAYLRIRALAAPAMLVVTAGHGAYRGMHDTRTPMGVTLAANLTNAVLDPVLIFGFGWGIEGAAAATVVAQWGAAVTFIWLLRRHGNRAGWSWQIPRLAELRPMLATGGVLTIRTLFLQLTLTGATAVAAAIGSASVAAHQVLSQVWLLLAMTVDALAIAAQAMVADEIGKSDRTAARAVSLRLGWWGLAVGVVLMVLLLLGRGILAAGFGPDPEVSDLIGRAAVVAAVMQPLAALVFVADGVYLGLLRVRYLLYSTAAGAVAAGAVLAVVVAQGWGLEAVWWAVTAMIGARFVVLVAAFPRALSEAV